MLLCDVSSTAQVNVPLPHCCSHDWRIYQLRKSVVLAHGAAAADARAGTGVPKLAWDVAGTGQEHAWTRATFTCYSSDSANLFRVTSRGVTLTPSTFPLTACSAA